MIVGHVYPFDDVDPLRPPEPRLLKLYTTKRTPRGSVVVLGDTIVSEYEMRPKEAQRLADRLNNESV